MTLGELYDKLQLMQELIKEVKVQNALSFDCSFEEHQLNELRNLDITKNLDED